MNKRISKLVLTAILAILFATSLFAATEPAVVRLHGYIPPTTTFTANADGFEVVSNSRNFTYSVIEKDNSKLLLVVAQ